MIDNTPADEDNKIKGQGSYFKWFKKLLYLAGAVFIGALGSGLWENVISPFLSWLSKNVFYFFRFISSSFTDSVYRNVSNGFYESSSTQIINTFLIVFLTIFYLLIALYPIIPKKIKLEKKKAIIFWAFIVVGVSSSLFGILMNIYISETVTKTLSNIEIISPAIEEKEYRMLKSEFHSMTGEKDFLELQKKITEIAEKNNFRLKKWEN